MLLLSRSPLLLLMFSLLNSGALSRSHSFSLSIIFHFLAHLLFPFFLISCVQLLFYPYAFVLFTLVVVVTRAVCRSIVVIVVSDGDAHKQAAL